MSKTIKSQPLSLSDILSAHIPDPSIATLEEACDIIALGAAQDREQAQSRFSPFLTSDQQLEEEQRDDVVAHSSDNIRSRVVHSDPLGLPFWGRGDSFKNPSESWAKL